MALKFNNNYKCPFKKEAEGNLTEGERRGPCNYGVRNKSDVGTSHGMLVATRSRKRQEIDSPLDIPE